MCAIVFYVSTSRHISLWVPEELLAQLDVCAHEANRTRSQEIVLRLRESVQPMERIVDEHLARG